MESSPRLTLCLEQTLGHRMHGLNLERAAGSCVAVERIEFPERPRVRAPWALRGSVAAARRLRHRAPADVTLFHTQTVSLFAPLATRGGRFVVSFDATPLQMDELGRWYDHGRHWAPVEAGKRRWYRWVFKHAAGIVTWSQWAAGSAAVDYGVDSSKIFVAHPGAPAEFFEIPRKAKRARPRILFVGGDFERKGGPLLLDAFARLEGKAELDLVTAADVDPARGVRVLRDVRPGSPEQLRAYAAADIFCLPTLGDCTSVALGEAMAAGLPVVTTTIASNPEWVPSEVGRVVEPNDGAALHAALEELVDDAAARRRAGEAARAWAREHMDAAANARRVLGLMAELA